MTDWGKSGRRDTYEFRLVDPFTLQETGETATTPYGKSSIASDIDGENLVTADIQVQGGLPRNRLVRIYHTIEIPGAETITGCAGTFFCETSEATATYRSITRDYSGYSTLYRFTDDVLVEDFSKPAGTNIADEIREFVGLYDGQVNIASDALDNQQRCHTVPVYWPKGDTKASQVLLDICGWTDSVLSVDTMGYLVVEPYVAPEDRGLAYVFDTGDASVYETGVTYSTNELDIDNRCLAYWQRDQVPTNSDGTPKDSFGLADQAVVTRPDSDPMSHANLGRWKTHVIRVNDPVTHDELAAQAQRYLDDQGALADYYTITGPSVPSLGPGSKVQYRNYTDHSKPIDCICEIVRKSPSLGAGCLTEWKLSALTYNQVA